MWTQWFALGLAAAFVSALGAAVVSHNPESSTSPPRPFPRPFSEVGLVVGPGDHLAPDLKWPFLAWEDRGPSSSSVHALDLASGRRIDPGGWGPWQRFPQLNGPLLAFASGYRDSPGGCPGGFCSYVFNLSSGQRFEYSGPGLTQVAVAGPYFAQVDPFGSPGFARDLTLRHIANGSWVYRRAIAEPPDGSTGPVAQGNAVVLSTRPYGTLCMGFDPHGCVNTLGVLFLNNLTHMRLTHSVGVFDRHVSPQWRNSCWDFTVENVPRVFGSMVYWQDNRNSQFVLDPSTCTWSGNHWDVYGFDLESWEEVPIRTNPWNETHPDADGSLLVWADDRNGNWDIYGMWLDTGEEFQVTDDPATQRNPVVSNGCVAWEDNRNGKWDIYGTCPSEQRPVANAGGPYTGFENSPITFDASASRDPDGDPLTFRWDFHDDGTWDTNWSSSPTATYTYGDDWSGKARVEVSDGTFTDTAESNVRVLSVPPTIWDTRAYVVANVALRVAGERWHDVRLDLVGNVTASVRVVRYPGSPDHQQGTITGGQLELSEDFRIGVHYTPTDDPMNGQSNGASPVWVIITMPDGSEIRLHHTFNAEHPSTYEWTPDDLRPYLVGQQITFQATAHDPGSDDLTFRWSFGDGSADASTIYYNNGVLPDPYPSAEVNPITVTDAHMHAFALAGTYAITLTVTDDDGAAVSTTIRMAVRR